MKYSLRLIRRTDSEVLGRVTAVGKAVQIHMDIPSAPVLQQEIIIGLHGHIQQQTRLNVQNQVLYPLHILSDLIIHRLRHLQKIIFLSDEIHYVWERIM